MCLHVKASGLGASSRDQSVSVLIHLMQGLYDDELPWSITKIYNIDKLVIPISGFKRLALLLLYTNLLLNEL